MWEGKINGALKMMRKDCENGVLQIDEKVLKDLKLKHLAPAEVKKDSLLHGPMIEIPSYYFDEIDEMMKSCVSYKRFRWSVTCKRRSFSTYAIEKEI